MTFYEKMKATVKDAGNFYVGLLVSILMGTFTTLFSVNVGLVLLGLSVAVVVCSGVFIMVFSDYEKD